MTHELGKSFLDLRLKIERHLQLSYQDWPHLKKDHSPEVAQAAKRAKDDAGKTLFERPAPWGLNDERDANEGLDADNWLV